MKTGFINLFKFISYPKNTIKAKKFQKPFTCAINELGEVISVREGIFKLSDFEGAKYLNIVHKNNKTTIVRL